MVLPDGTGSQSSRPETGRAVLFAIAVLVIVFGFLLLGSLSPAEPVAVETTTTSPTTTLAEIEPPIDLENFSVEQIETGEPLDWRQHASFDNGYPIAMLEHDGALYVFVSESPFWTGADGGMTAWMWAGGVWTRIGEVIDDDFTVSQVISNGEELIAAGTRVDGAGWAIWHSPDGFDWTRRDLFVTDDDPATSTRPTAIGATEDLVVVATATYFDSQRLVAESLEEAGFDYNLTQWSWGINSIEEEGQVLTLQGPFGIVVDRIPLDRLDLTEEDRSWIRGVTLRPPETRFAMWGQRDGEPWQRTQIEGLQNVETIVPGPEGGLIAIGFGGSVSGMWITNDGQKWASLDPDQAPPWSFGRWGDRWAGPADMSVPEIMISENGGVWEEAGLAEYFPQSIEWHVRSFAAGPGGVALTAGRTGTLARPEPPEPVALTLSEETTLTIDYADGTLSVQSGLETYVWYMYEPSDDERMGLEVDLKDEVVQFTDLETGEALGSVGIDVLRSAEQDLFLRRRTPGEAPAFVFTPDAENWTIQDIDGVFGETAVIADLEVAERRVMAAVFTDGFWSPRQDDFPFEIWSAPIP